MFEESKYWSDVMKKHLNKELVTTKGGNENFQNSNKCWICDHDYINTKVKMRDHCHITGKCRGSAYWNCNHKIPIVFHNLKKYDSHLLMHELGKFNLKTSVIPNELERYTSLTINDKLSFVDSFQFLRSSLDSLVKNLKEYDFKYLS